MRRRCGTGGVLDSRNAGVGRGRPWRGPSALSWVSVVCTCRQSLPSVQPSSSRVVGTAELPMAPPRDTAGSAGTHQPQPADAPPRYNQKSTTLRNGATEEGWFYPTPAALKAAPDVRGTRAARESCRLRTMIQRPHAQATRRPTTRTSSSTRTTRTAWCTGSSTRAPSPLNLCLRSPEVA